MSANAARLPVAAALLLIAVTVRAQDTCDVTFQLDAPGPLQIVTFGVDYSAAGGEFVGDSSLPGFGPSWGSAVLACTALVSVDEVTAFDDNAGVVSIFFASLAGTLAGPLPLVSCVFALDAGFPCPGPTDFAIVDASFPDDPFPPPFPLPAPPAMSLSVSPRTPICGDGFQEGSEECDDGNTTDGDCCSSACALAAQGTPCDDGSVCTGGETCDSAGRCVVGSTLACDDGLLCTLDRCDPGAGCVSEPIPNTSGTCGHWTTGTIDVRDHPSADSDDQLRLNLKLAGGEIGNPSATTDYAICVFDHVAGVPVLVDQIQIPGGPPWAARGGSGSFGYIDLTRATEGVEKIRLKQNSQGTKGKFLLNAKGVNLTLPGPVDAMQYLAADPQVIVQIENSAGGCWWNAFDPSHGPLRNEPNRFKAKRK